MENTQGEDYKDYSFKLAAQIQIPEQFFKPYRCGMKAFDDIISELGGLIPSQVVITSGKAGSGKTTLWALVGSVMAHRYKIAMISLEMSKFQLAYMARKIPGFGGIHVTGAFHPTETFRMLDALKPDIIILDSLQKAAGKLDMGTNAAQIHLTELFTAYAKKNWCCVNLIGHCDKAGNYKGPSSILHEVDTHLMVKYDREQDIRTFCIDKNRFGGIIEEMLFGITREKVWVGSPYITQLIPGATLEDDQPVITAEEFNNAELPESVPFEGTTKDAIKLCCKDLDTKWDGGTARALVGLVIAFMKEEDRIFRSRAYVKDPNRVKVEFKGTVLSQCHPQSGLLTFATSVFSKLDTDQVAKAKEKKFMVPRTLTKPDLLIWVVLREWVRCYDGMESNSNAYYETVGRTFDQFKEDLAKP